MNSLKKLALLTITAVLLAGLIAGLAGCSQEEEEAVTLNVFAAASLTDVMEEINGLYTGEHSSVTITPNYGSSGKLQTQIEQGAPCDVFISAGARQMDALQSENMLLTDSRRDLLQNKVVLIVPSDSTLGLADFNGLTGASVTRIAIGDPASVPAGSYGKKALEKLGIYSQVQSKLVLCTDVRDVLTHVENGDVEAGIVYETDYLISTKVKKVAEGPAEVNATIVYPVAVIEETENAEAAGKYVDFLFSDEAGEVFEEYGFVLVQD